MINKVRKKILISFLAMIFIIGSVCNISFAKDEDSEIKGEQFSVNAELTSQEDSPSYDLGVEVYNGSKNFKGILRVLVSNGYDASCAYDTEISQAEKTTKTYTVKVAPEAVSSVNNTVQVMIISESGKTIKSQAFSKIFSNNKGFMPVGVLSDSFNKLSYLDMGGKSIFLMTDDYCLKLNQLDSDNIVTELEKMRYLIIDNYDISILSKESIQTIEKWVNNGGMLIIGTGANGDKQFSAFESDFIEAELIHGNSSENSSENSNESSSEVATTGDAATTSDFTFMADNYYSSTPVEMANIEMSAYEEIYDLKGRYKAEGDGSILILNYSLSDPKVSDSDRIDEMTYSLFDHATDMSNFILSNGGNNLEYYNIEEALEIIQGYTPLNISLLKWIAVIYVFVLGPIAYIILKLLKKREAYWIVVPVLALLFVGIIYVAGREISVEKNAANSISVEEANGKGLSDVFVSCYKAEPDEWEVKTSKSTLFAGPVSVSFGSTGHNEGYSYRMVNASEGYKLGFVPGESFESALFSVKRENTSSGGIDYDVEISASKATGTVTNNTGNDFDYLLVLDGEEYVVVKDVKAGETVDLSKTDLEVEPKNLSDPDNFLTDVVEQYYDNGEYDEASATAAIYIGLCNVYEYDMTAVFGSVKDYKNVTDDKKMSENSWGCIYQTGVN